MKSELVATIKKGKHEAAFHDVTLQRRRRRSPNFDAAVRKELMVIDGKYYGGTFFVRTKNGKYWGWPVFETLGDHPWGGDFETRMFGSLDACAEHLRQDAAKSIDHTLESYRQPIAQQLTNRHNLYDKAFHQQGVTGRFALYEMARNDRGREDAALLDKAALKKFKELMKFPHKTDLTLPERLDTPFNSCKQMKMHAHEADGCLVAVAQFQEPLETLLRALAGKPVNVARPTPAEVEAAWEWGAGTVAEMWDKWQAKLDEELLLAAGGDSA